MAAITKNPFGGVIGKTVGKAATKVTGASIFEELGNAERKYASDPFGNASKDWGKLTGKTNEPARAVKRPRYTGYTGTGI